MQVAPVAWPAFVGRIKGHEALSRVDVVLVAYLSAILIRRRDSQSRYTGSNKAILI